MGNYRFRLSDMIPNAWFYKLKDMSKSRNLTKKKQQMHNTSSTSAATATTGLPSKAAMQPHLLSNQRKSYYFTRDLINPPTKVHDTFYDNVATNSRTSDAVHFSEPPRKSSKKRRSTRRSRAASRASPRLVSSSVTAGCSCRATLESVWTRPDSTPEKYPNSPIDSSSEDGSLLPQYGSSSGLTPETFDGMLSWSASCRCRVDNDIVIDMDNKPLKAEFDEPVKLDRFDTIAELDLPPIITNSRKLSPKTNETDTNEPTKFRRSTAKYEERNAYGSLSVEIVKEGILGASRKQQKTSPARRFSVNSPGLKLRTNSPRIANRRIQGRRSVSSSSSSSSRKSVSDSFAIVKSSKDPQRDFRESMVEMIVENNICASKDLEELLACYLSLNSDEYHDLIIKVFRQIWFDYVDIHAK